MTNSGALLAPIVATAVLGLFAPLHRQQEVSVDPAQLQRFISRGRVNDLYNMFEAKDVSHEDILFAAIAARADLHMSLKAELDLLVSGLRGLKATSSQVANEKNEMRRIVLSLRHQHHFQYFRAEPGSPASVILNRGQDAIPYLIEQLDNGDYSRSVVFTNKYKYYILRVGDCAHGLLQSIAKSDFGGPYYLFDDGSRNTPQLIKTRAEEWWKLRQRQHAK